MRSSSNRDSDRSGFVSHLIDEAKDVSAKALAVAIIGLVVLVGAGAWKFVAGSESTASSTTTTSSSSTSSTTSTPGPTVAGAELERCDVPVDHEGLEWVQVESSTLDETDWVTPGVAEASGLGLEFCDGSMFRTTGSALMLSPPLTEQEADRLAGADPPASLSRVCELRKAMRIAGGQLPFRSPDMQTYFSSFILQPSDDWIGPNRCFPLLAGDEEFGSRAALDRYFGILDELSGDPSDLPAVTADLDEVTTPEFRSKSGDVEAILIAWRNCKKVDVTYLSAPHRVRAFDHVEVHVDCIDATGARKDRKYVLAVAPPAAAGGIWRLHWDPDRWGEVPPAT